MVLGSVPFMVATATYEPRLLWVATGALLFVVGGILLRTGMKHSAPRGEEILLEDERPPIVYLRSFADETYDSRVGSFIRGAFAPRISSDVPAWASQEQLLLGKYLSKIGPYIAVGRPGEPLPELGASRIYVGEQWQERVLDLLKRAKLVILRAGSTKGLQWELEQLRASANPGKILMILPVARKHYRLLRRWAADVFPVPLPESQPVQRLVIFEEDWTPMLLPDRHSLDETLRPFLARNGIVPPTWSAVWKANL